MATLMTHCFESQVHASGFKINHRISVADCFVPRTIKTRPQFIGTDVWWRGWCLRSVHRMLWNTRSNRRYIETKWKRPTDSSDALHHFTARITFLSATSLWRHLKLSMRLNWWRILASASCWVCHRLYTLEYTRTPGQLRTWRTMRNKLCRWGRHRTVRFAFHANWRGNRDDDVEKTKISGHIAAKYRQKLLQRTNGAEHVDDRKITDVLQPINAPVCACVCAN